MPAPLERKICCQRIVGLPQSYLPPTVLYPTLFSSNFWYRWLVNAIRSSPPPPPGTTSSLYVSGVCYIGCMIFSFNFIGYFFLLLFFTPLLGFRKFIIAPFGVYFMMVDGLHMQTLAQFHKFGEIKTQVFRFPNRITNCRPGGPFFFLGENCNASKWSRIGLN